MATQILVSKNRSNSVVMAIGAIRWLNMRLAFVLYLAVTSVGSQKADDPSLTLTYNIMENLPPGIFVANIVEDSKLAQELDETQLHQLQFEILQGAHKSNFAVESPSGLLKTRTTIDRDAICRKLIQCVFSLDVAIVRPPQHFRVFKVRVNVIDANDNTPEFGQTSLSLTMSENALPGTVFVLPPAFDADSGIFDVQSYKMSVNGTKFRLISDKLPDGSLDIRLEVSEKLDRELESSYWAVVTAFDGDNPPKTGTLEIQITVLDANDNVPVFDKDMYNVSVREDFPVNGILVRVRAQDADEGPNGDVRYHLAQQSRSLHGNTFQLDPETGDMSLGVALDFEKESSYTILVVASDQGPDSIPVYAKVAVQVEDVNDNTPEIRLNAVNAKGIAELAENEPPLTFVAHISAEDADSGLNGEVSCELLHGAGSGFGLEPLGRTKEFKLVTTRATFDRELADEYAVTVLCRDGGLPSLSSTAEVLVRLIDVNDNPPRFDRSVYSVSVKEGNELGLPLLRVNASDPDFGANSRIEYLLCPEAKNYLSIDNVTGLITAEVVFDYEKAKEVELCVHAKDAGSPIQLTATAKVSITIVDVNDEAPRFGQGLYTFGTYENQLSKTEIGSVSAYDPDTDPFDKFHFSIVSVDPPGLNSFQVEPTTGLIRTSKPLDRELCAVHRLVVSATNLAAPFLSATANVTIYVADKNDNAPEFEFPISGLNDTLEVSRFSPIGHTFGRVLAFDRDTGNNAKLVFSIAKGNTEGLFDIDSPSGALQFVWNVHSPNFRSQKLMSHSDDFQVTLTISVSDMGSPPKTSAAILHVIVTSHPAPEVNVINQQWSETSGDDANTHRKILIVVACLTVVIVFFLIGAIACLRWRQSNTMKKYRTGSWTATQTAKLHANEPTEYQTISDFYKSALNDAHANTPIYKGSKDLNAILGQSSKSAQVQRLDKLIDEALEVSRWNQSSKRNNKKSGPVHSSYNQLIGSLAEQRRLYINRELRPMLENELFEKESDESTQIKYHSTPSLLDSPTRCHQHSTPTKRHVIETTGQRTTLAPRMNVPRTTDDVQQWIKQVEMTKLDHSASSDELQPRDRSVLDHQRVQSNVETNGSQSRRSGTGKGAKPEVPRRITSLKTKNNVYNI